MVLNESCCRAAKKRSDPINKLVSPLSRRQCWSKCTSGIERGASNRTSCHNTDRDRKSNGKWVDVFWSTGIDRRAKNDKNKKKRRDGFSNYAGDHSNMRSQIRCGARDGHRSIDRVPAAVLKIVDVKCPGSGEHRKNDWSNLARLAPHDEVKFVVSDRADYDFARDVIATYDLFGRASAVLISPVHGGLDPKTLSEWMLADRLPARLQLQLHKFIWAPETRGV